MTRTYMVLAGTLATVLFAGAVLFYHNRGTHESMTTTLAPQAGRKRFPDAVIIGVKKGGTRALLEYLRIHPSVRAPGPEIHFFDRYYTRGLEWYRNQMPLVKPGELCIEKTPAYFVKKDVPARMRKMNPNVKLLVVVRDPVTRAISDYTQSFAKGRTTRSFEDMAFLDWNHDQVDSKWNAIRLGIYHKHLRKWIPYFPLSSIHFVSGEKLISDPANEMKLVEEFLQLPNYISQRHFSYNTTKGFPCVLKHPEDKQHRCLGKTKGREHPKIEPHDLETLKRFFRPHNALLFNQIGRNFGWE